MLRSLLKKPAPQPPPTEPATSRWTPPSQEPEPEKAMGEDRKAMEWMAKDQYAVFVGQQWQQLLLGTRALKAGVYSMVMANELTKESRKYLYNELAQVLMMLEVKE